MIIAMYNCQDIYFPTDEETSHISGNIATVCNVKSISSEIINYK